MLGSPGTVRVGSVFDAELRMPVKRFCDVAVGSFEVTGSWLLLILIPLRQLW